VSEIGRGDTLIRVRRSWLCMGHRLLLVVCRGWICVAVCVSHVCVEVSTQNP
jgi:hypothetical protein